MPHKYNADRRHHIARPKRRVTNWSEYNEALRQRGSLTVWFTEEAIAAWKAAPRTTPGGQPHYSDLAIAIALTLRAVFHLPLRDFGAEMREWADFALSRNGQATRRDTGMPRPVMMLMTLHAILASVFCVGSSRL